MELAIAIIAMLCIIAVSIGALWVVANEYIKWRHKARMSKADYAQAMADVDATRIRAESEGRAVILRAMVAPATEGGTATIFDERGALVIGEVRHLVPHTLTDARRYSTPMLNTGALSTTPEPIEIPALPIPPFSELLKSGAITTDAFTLGYADGVPIQGEWDDLYSSAIGGVSGSGKSTTTRFVVAQAALRNTRFGAIDPMMHTQNAEKNSLAFTLMPLEKQFVCKPAATDDEILQLIAMFHTELKRRITGGSYDFPLILAVDEFSRLMRNAVIAKVLTPLMLDTAQHGRHVDFFGLALSQIWKGSTSGGTEIRDSFASRYVHRMPRVQARMLLPSEEANRVERLKMGQAVLHRTDGSTQIVSIPNTTYADIQHVAALVEGRGNSDGIQSVLVPDVNTTPFQSAKPLDAGEARVISLFCAGKSVADIVRELYGDVKGRSMQDRSTEIQEVIRAFASQFYGNAGMNLG